MKTTQCVYVTVVWLVNHPHSWDHKLSKAFLYPTNSCLICNSNQFPTNTEILNSNPNPHQIPIFINQKMFRMNAIIRIQNPLNSCNKYQESKSMIQNNILDSHLFYFIYNMWSPYMRKLGLGPISGHFLYLAGYWILKLFVNMIFYF